LHAVKMMNWWCSGNHASMHALPIQKMMAPK
jgi:hypothetical protein